MPSSAFDDSSREARRQAADWRIRLDDAWRSPALRHAFESDTGLRPLAVTGEAAEAEDADGYTGRYHQEFIIWATKYLGLENAAPKVVREKLSAGLRL